MAGTSCCVCCRCGRRGQKPGVFGKRGHCCLRLGGGCGLYVNTEGQGLGFSNVENCGSGRGLPCACVIISYLLIPVALGGRTSKVAETCFFYQYLVTKCRVYGEGQGPLNHALVQGHDSDTCPVTAERL